MRQHGAALPHMDERTERRAEAAYAEFRRTRGPRAMAEVFDLTAGELLLFARRFATDAAGAEDLVQQTFVRAIERAERFDASRRLLPWLLAILANEARMLRRRGEPDAARLAVRDVAGPPQEAAQRETRRALDAALAELPADYRDVVAMRHLHGMQPRRIAAALAIPVATVKTRLRRGVQKLAASLPPGLAFAAAISLLAGRGLAATRRAVLVRSGAVPTALGTIGGLVTMKKLAFALAAALVLLATLPLWWNPEPERPAAPAQSATAVAAATQGEAPADAPKALERTVAADAAAAPPASMSPTLSASVFLVRAVWRRSREPAAHVPFAVHADGGCIAQLWTDEAGEARLAPGAPAWHTLLGMAGELVEMSTPFLPGGRSIVELTSKPGGVGGIEARIEVELEDGQHVRGLVVDATGNPVAGADVRLSTGYGYPATVIGESDAAGAFDLEGLPADFKLQASAGAWESAPATIADLAGKEQLVLRLDRCGDLLQVRVVADGKPVELASVRLCRDRFKDRQVNTAPRNLFGYTAADGMAAFAGLPAGSYVVEVVHASHPPAQRRLTTEAAGGVRIETIALGESATLIGSVRRGGRPAAYMQVGVEDATSLFQRHLNTDQDGHFTADRLPIGRLTLAFERDATSVRRSVDLHAGEQRLEFELPGGASIAGRLLLPDGSAAARWNVAALRTTEMVGACRAVTGADGSFVCDNLPPATYRLTVTGPDGGGHEFFGVRTDGLAVDYRLPPASLWQPASITGRFDSAPAGASLFLAEAHLGSASGEKLDAGGTFERGSLAPGRYRLWLEQDETVLWLAEAELASGERKDLGTVSLPRCGGLIVTLRATSGVDSSRAHVLLRPTFAAGGTSFGPRPQPGADGAWHCERVPTGAWWLRVGGDGIAPDVREILIEPGATQRIEVELQPAVAVTFRLDAGGADASAVGSRHEIVRRTGDGAIMVDQHVMAPLLRSIDLAAGSFTIEVDTGGGFHGTAAFDVPAPTPIEVPLARR